MYTHRFRNLQPATKNSNWPEILEKYARQFDWIQVLRLENGLSRRPGAAVIHAFASGFDLVHAEPVEFVVKLDCDVELPPSYFENLIARFAADPALALLVLP